MDDKNKIILLIYSNQARGETVLNFFLARMCASFAEYAGLLRWRVKMSESDTKKDACEEWPEGRILMPGDKIPSLAVLKQYGTVQVRGENGFI